MLDWRKLLGAKTPSIPELESSLAALQAEAVEAAAEVAALAAGRRAVLLDGTDDALRKHDEKAAATARRRDRAEVAAEEISAKLDTARTDAAEAVRRARYEAADAQATAARAELRRVYPDAIARLRSLLRQLAEADLAVDAANRDLPAGAARLAGPEDFRLGRGRREETVSTETVELWSDSSGRPQSVEAQSYVVADHNGFGRIPEGRPGTPGVRNSGLRMVAFTATTVRPADDFPAVDSLAVSLFLPPMLPGEAPGWTPMNALYASQPNSTSAPVIEELDRVEAVKARGRRPEKVRYEPVSWRDLGWDIPPDGYQALNMSPR